MRPGGIRELDGGSGDSSLTCGEVFGFTDGSRNYIEADCTPLIGRRWATEGVGPWQLAARVDDTIVIPAMTPYVPGNFKLDVFGATAYGADGALIPGVPVAYDAPGADPVVVLPFDDETQDISVGLVAAPVIPSGETLQSVTVTCPAFPGLTPGDSRIEIGLSGLPFVLAQFDPAVGASAQVFATIPLPGSAFTGRQVVLTLRIRPVGLYPYTVPNSPISITWNTLTAAQNVTDVCELGSGESAGEEFGMWSLTFSGIPLFTNAPESGGARRQGLYHHNLILFRTGPGGVEFGKSFPAVHVSEPLVGVRGIAYNHRDEGGGIDPIIRVTRLDGENFNPGARLRVWID